MKVRSSLLQIAATIIFFGALAQAQPHEAARGSGRGSSVQLGDKVVVIPAPEGYEEAGSQFKEVNDRFVSTEAPGADFLLAHLPAAQCQLLRNGAPLELNRYTKIAVMKAIRNLAFAESDMAGAIAEFRKNSGAMFDPDGPTMKAVMENAERGLTNLASRPIELGLNGTQNLGEFDVRPDVYSVMLLITYKVGSEGTQSTMVMLASLTFLKVKQRLLYVTAYRKISSPAALKTELKPGISEMKQFTTKWVNEILAANKEG